MQLLPDHHRIEPQRADFLCSCVGLVPGRERPDPDPGQRAVVTLQVLRRRG